MALVDEKTEQFNHRILVIPAHLAKGLEFDGVIVVAIDEKYTMVLLEIKLMYVAMTRAMHRLAIVGVKNQIPYDLEQK